MAKRLSFDAVPAISESQSTLIAPTRSSENTGLEDIKTLLYLETLKRYKDHETNIRIQAEEKGRLHEEAQAENRFYYELFVQLIKAAVTKAFLDNVINTLSFSNNQLDQLETEISAIKKRVINDKSIAYFKPEIVKQCQEEIRNIKNHDRIVGIQEEIIKQKNAVKAINLTNESIEQKLEAVTAQIIEFYTEQIQNNHLEKEPNNVTDTSLE